MFKKCQCVTYKEKTSNAKLRRNIKTNQFIFFLNLVSTFKLQYFWMYDYLMISQPHDLLDCRKLCINISPICHAAAVDPGQLQIDHFCSVDVPNICTI